MKLLRLSQMAAKGDIFINPRYLLSVVAHKPTGAIVRITGDNVALSYMVQESVDELVSALNIIDRDDGLTLTDNNKPISRYGFVPSQELVVVEPELKTHLTDEELAAVMTTAENSEEVELPTCDPSEKPAEEAPVMDFGVLDDPLKPTNSTIIPIKI